MKKLILASAIAAITAGSAQAATVYEGKGLTYKVKGDFQVQLRKDLGDNQHLDVEFDDLEIKNSIEYAFGENLTAFGQLDFGFKNAAEDKQAGGEQVGSNLEEAYLGLDFGMVRVAVGKMDFASDEFGVDAAYENKNNEDRFDAQGTSGDDVIRVDAQVGNLDLVASYELEAKGEDSANGKSLDLYVGTEIAGVELGAAYQTRTAETVGAKSEKTWGLSAAFDAGVAKIGADYSTSDLNGNDKDQLNLVAIVPVTATTKVALGMAMLDGDLAADDVNEWYANVTYKVASQKKISVFAEIADTDENDVDLGYLVGMRLRF
ncbi:MAG: porin [Motiliproteus sp.]